MPTSSYMPDVKVEIAFNAGFGTADASRTWTDVSAYVELDRGLTITYGRQDERSTADANQLTLTFDNRDGRFTPGNTSGAYTPNVKLYRPIRVTATPVDGSAQVEFVGYINEWPLSWDDGIDATNYVTVTASSRLARLGTTAALSNIVSQTILADSPAAYYTLGEPEGATQANDSSGNARPPLALAGSSSPAVVFGSATGPGTDGLTAVEIAGGQFLSGCAYTPTGSSVTIEVAFLVESDPVNEVALFSLVGGSTATAGVSLMMGGTSDGDAGKLLVRSGTQALVVGPSTASYSDNATHWATVTITGGTVTVYVDGSSVLSAAMSSLSTSLNFTLRLGDYPEFDIGRIGSALILNGALAHCAIYDSALSGTRIAAHSDAALTGFEGEAADARVERYAAFAGIPTAEVNAEASNVLVSHIDTTDQQVVELLRKIEATEGGVLFDNRDGALTFHNRAHRYLLSSSFTLNMASHMVEADYTPKVDGAYVLNDVNTANTGGTVTAYRFDASSISDYGLNHADLETADTDDDGPLFLASWTLYKYKDPRERTATLAVVCTEQVGKTPNCATVMAANVGDKITVSNRPTQIKPASVDYFVEGYTRTYGPESVVTVFNVSPSSPEDQVLKIGDSTRGVIGTNPVAF